ncbi:MAG TPA: SDR family oxidoreductase [Phnomibacter sp.]|nr:SDR family oxidoreductase [Phnomibacter sp.]
MKVFITGATGYIGGQLAKRLVYDGHDVVALCIESLDEVSGEGITWRPGDLADKDFVVRSMKGCEVVFHCAALARQWHPDPDAFFKINVTGTQNILDAAATNRVKKLVVTSTAGVYGRSLSIPLTESDPRLEPFDNDYDLSKHYAEELVREYVKNGHHAVMVNPSRVYGPGQSTTSNPFIKLIRDYIQKPYYLVPGKGEAIHSYTYVEDVAQGHLLAMEKGRPGENYLLGGENASYNDLYAMLSRLTGLRRKKICVPEKMIHAFARCNMLWTGITGKDPLITPSFARRISTSRMYNSEKARQELGYCPTPLEEGLRRTLHAIGHKATAPEWAFEFLS